MENYLKQYVSFRNRLEKFCTATDYETQKTYANTAALLDRAELLTTGATPHGRFGCDGGVTVQTLTARALSYIEALERGEFPLKGKFSPPGEWIADHSVVVKGEEVHIFFNKHDIGYEWAQRPCRSFGHIVSTDLKNWETLPNVLACENNGPDSYQIWSPSIVQKDGTYYMIYTGVNYEMAQSACLAWSTDLISWEKCPQNPVFTPPPSWSDWKETAWSDCRDHFVYHDGEQYVMLYCTMRKTESGEKEHCSGIAYSTDLFSWTDGGTFRMPGLKQACESPFFTRLQGKDYFLYTNCGVGMCYSVGMPPNRLSAPQALMVTEQPKGLAFVPSCAEIFTFRKKTYITVAERLPGNEQYLEIKELFVDENGSLSVGKRIE
ncbi:MAG: family 43 glycosylhydrolase [Clostridia bacterium]|nr:family 43 glycosylhydrolase [Clostridia bacterium]